MHERAVKYRMSLLRTTRVKDRKTKVKIIVVFLYSSPICAREPATPQKKNIFGPRDYRYNVNFQSVSLGDQSGRILGVRVFTVTGKG